MVRAVFFVELVAHRIVRVARVITLMNMSRIVNLDHAQGKKGWNSAVTVKIIPAPSTTNS
jgi:hypothetical protein